MDNYHKYKQYKEQYKNLKGGTSSPEESARSKLQYIVGNTNIDAFDKAKEIYYYHVDDLDRQIFSDLKKMSFYSIPISAEFLTSTPAIINDNLKRFFYEVYCNQYQGDNDEYDVYCEMKEEFDMNYGSVHQSNSSVDYSQIREGLKFLLQSKQINRLEENTRFMEYVNSDNPPPPNTRILITAYTKAKDNKKEFLNSICRRFSHIDSTSSPERNDTSQHSNLDDSFHISRPDSESPDPSLSI